MNYSFSSMGKGCFEAWTLTAAHLAEQMSSRSIVRIPPSPIVVWKTKEASKTIYVVI